MTDFTISAVRGTTIGFTITAERAGLPIALNQPGMQLVVTGKLQTSDAAPVFVADYYASGGAPNGNIALTADPSNSVADVEIPANHPGILALTKTSYIVVSAVLLEPNGRKTEIASGVIKLRVTAGS